MYNRVRTRIHELPNRADWIRSESYVITYLGPGGGSTPYRLDFPQSTDYISEYESGVISDNSIKVRHKSQQNVRHKNKSIPRPCGSVDHLRTRIIPNLDDTYFEHTLSYESYPYRYDDTFSEQLTPVAYACRIYGYDFVKSQALAMSADLGIYSFRRPDWFSIVDQFNESIDQLMTSSFFGGEDIAESSIYKDALLLLIKPKRYLPEFFRHVIASGLKGKSLGEIESHYRRASRAVNLSGLKYARDLGVIPAALKDAVNANLLYKFGVAPAIQDIRTTLNLHQKVKDRLRFLNIHAGRYVPIRVRRTLPCVFDSSQTSHPIFEDMTTRQSAQQTECCMFAMGRVRNDIANASVYRAYAESFGLNKIVGTAWELIPFTFVLDWFTNAQERINSLTRIQLGEGTFYNLVGIGHSIKDTVKHELLIVPGNSSTYGCPMTSPNSLTTVLTVENSRYTRLPGLPDTSGVVDLSALGSFQGYTGLELLLQKRR